MNATHELILHTMMSIKATPHRDCAVLPKCYVWEMKLYEFVIFFTQLYFM